MHGFLLFLGAGLVGMGMILVLSNLKNVARRKHILATATSPISQAMGGPVEIKGNIVPSEKGLVEAPLSGRQAVWTRVTVTQFNSGSGTTGGSSTVLNEVNGRPFFVDDSSGEVARIIPDGANVVLDQQSVGNSGQFHDAPPGFEEFLSARGLSSKSFFGFNKTMSFYEELLTPGDALYARGPSRREQGRSNSEGSGTAPLGQLVMYASTGAGGAPPRYAPSSSTPSSSTPSSSTLCRRLAISCLLWVRCLSSTSRMRAKPRFLSASTSIPPPLGSIPAASQTMSISRSRACNRPRR